MVKIDTSSPEGLHSTLEGLLAAQSDTQAALAKLAGPGLVAEAALEGSGVAAFRAKDGGLRLTDSVRREKLEHGGETYVVEATVPGLFSAGAEAHLSAGEAAAVAAGSCGAEPAGACEAAGEGSSAESTARPSGGLLGPNTRGRRAERLP